MNRRAAIGLLLPAFALAGAALLGACDKVSPPGMSRPDAADGSAASSPPPPSSPTTAPATTDRRPAAPATTAPADDTTAAFLGLQGPKPEHWQWQPPESSMRAASYVIPGDEDGGPAELVVFYFGPGQGGSDQANIDRWAGQFTSPSGGPVVPVITRTSSDGMDVTLVELAGTYLGMGTSPPAPDTLFLAAIVDAPVGNVYLRLTGPTATVEREREAFMTLVRGLERTDAP